MGVKGQPGQDLSKHLGEFFTARPAGRRPDPERRVGRLPPRPLEAVENSAARRPRWGGRLGGVRERLRTDWYVACCTPLSRS